MYLNENTVVSTLDVVIVNKAEFVDSVVSTLDVVIVNKAEFVDSAIPTLALMTEGNQVVGYLHPFRGYRFQVSGTADGEGDYGSSEVLGLGNIMNAVYTMPETAKNSGSSIWSSNTGDINCGVIEALAWDAMCHFNGRCASIRKADSEKREFTKACIFVEASMDMHKKIRELATKTEEWIKSVM